MSEQIIYPKVISKQDPLIVRVNALSLVVGDSSFNAKIKMGTMYNGFYVYTTGIGEAITKIPVSIDGYNNTYVSGTNNTTEAYNHIVSVATEWMNELEESFAKDTSQKNLVELLETVIENASTGAEIRIDATDANVANAISTLDENNQTALGSNSGIAKYLNDINTTLNLIHSDLSDIKSALGVGDGTFGKLISDAVTTGLQSMVTQMNAMNTTITGVKNTIGTKDDDNTTTLFGTVNTTKSTTDTINTNVGSANDSGTTTLCGIANTIKGNVDTIKTTTSDMSTTMGKVSDSSSTQTMCGILNNIKTTTSGGSSASDVSAIKTVVDEINRNTNSSSNLYTKVSDIKTAVGSTSQTSSNTICGNTNYIRNALAADDTGAMIWNGHYWSIKTELTHDDMIVDDSGTNKVKAIVD